jgi:hypothetical protein
MHNFEGTRKRADHLDRAENLKLPNSSVSSKLRKLCSSFLTGAVFIGAVPKEAEGGIMRETGTAMPGERYLQFGAQEFSNIVVAIQRAPMVSSTISYATGIKIDPYHILTAAHVIDSSLGYRTPAQLLVLIGGTSFFNPEQQISVAEYVIHPSDIEGDLTPGAGIDLAILRTSQPMPGPYAQIGNTPATAGTVLSCGGYGKPGLSGATATTHDGVLRGGKALCQGPSSQFNSSQYGEMVGQPYHSYDRPIVASEGSSGMPIKNLDGLVVAMAVVSNFSATTTYLELTTPAVQQFIQEALNTTVTPRDQNNNGFTDDQETDLAAIPKKFHVGDSVNIDLSSILLPLPTGQTLGMTGLPKGLSFNPTTGVISGTITGMLGEAAVKILIKQPGVKTKELTFDLKVEPYKFLGSYDAILEDSNNMPRGKARLTVSSPGAFTATLEMLGQSKRSAKGVFTNPANGDEQTVAVTFAAGKGGVPAATTLNLTVRYNSALVSGSDGTHTARGSRLAKSGIAPKQAVTMALGNVVPGDRINTPAGTGYARGSVATTGSISLAGVLGDGQAFTTAPGLSETNQAVLWFQPYKDKTGSYVGGIVTVGDLGIPGRGASTESLSAGLKWRKVAGEKDLSYPLGIGVSNPLGLNARFSKWIPRTMADSLALSLGIESRQLFADYQSPTALAMPTIFYLTNGFNLTTLAPAMPAPFTGKLSGSNGAISGTLNKNIPLSGVMLQDQTFDTWIGTGILKFPTLRVPAVRGSFETGGFNFRNELLE